ncbi:TetR/AcrR family transcriptional regulator [Amycolatopsis sp., V23-08]|uniref:TetR/AcrR family transcriptional regulator n=1 Tax=Amycolatopsis heterodermiae TaxID=3110235 RepID=A0ABU5RIR9_9PSEU|nr:TetR/AcrR family transcriptional regulator [Amycolatopsis sp., V23-08]MEA5366176.1 TetR/AcrR family transcriptional regulator [Amycolatopsis sp., V23-08]
MSDSRALLLAAAAEQFAKHGPRGTRVQDIVKAAGVNERMIYHHFGNKDGLYAAALAAQQDGLMAAWQPVLDEAVTLDPYPGMRMALRAFAQNLMARPLLVALWMHESLGGWNTLPPPDSDTPIKELRALYERGQAEGVFRADCPFLVAHATATSAVVGLVVFEGRGRAFVDRAFGADPGPDGVLDLIVGQLLDGMSGPATS